MAKPAIQSRSAPGLNMLDSCLVTIEKKTRQTTHKPQKLRILLSRFFSGFTLTIKTLMIPPVFLVGVRRRLLKQTQAVRSVFLIFVSFYFAKYIFKRTLNAVNFHVLTSTADRHS